MPVKKGLVAAMADAKGWEFGIDDHDRVCGGRHRDEQLELQLALHSAELVKIKISSLRQFPASIIQKLHRLLN
jgi:hypothetical protein